MSIYFGGPKGIPGWIQKPVLDRLVEYLQSTTTTINNDNNNDNHPLPPRQQSQQPTKMVQILECSHRNHSRIFLVSDGHHSILLVLEEDADDDNDNPTTTDTTTTSNYHASKTTQALISSQYPLHRGSVISIQDWNVQVCTIPTIEDKCHHNDNSRIDDYYYTDPLFQRYAVTTHCCPNTKNNTTTKLAVYLRASRVICQGGQDLTLAAQDPIPILQDIDIRRALQSFILDNTNHQSVQGTVRRSSSSCAVSGILSRAQHPSSIGVLEIDNHNKTRGAKESLSLGNVAALFPNTTTTTNAPPPSFHSSATSTTTTTAPSSSSSSSMPMMGNVSQLFQSLTLQRHVIPKLVSIAKQTAQEQRFEDIIFGERNMPVVSGGIWQHHYRGPPPPQAAAAAAAATGMFQNGESSLHTCSIQPEKRPNSQQVNDDHQQPTTKPPPSVRHPKNMMTTKRRQPSSEAVTPPRLFHGDDAAESPSTTATTDSVRNIIATHRQSLLYNGDDAERLSCGSSSSSDEEEDENWGIDELFDPEPIAKKIQTINCSNNSNEDGHFTRNGYGTKAVEKDKSRKSATATEVGNQQHQQHSKSGSVTSLGILKDVKSNTLPPPQSVLPVPVDPYTSNMKKNVHPLVDPTNQPGIASRSADAAPSIPPPKKKKKKFQFGADSLRAFLSDN